MIRTDRVIDAKGLSCPMPIIKTKKAIKEMQPGTVLEVLATDKGSTADLKAWAESSGNQYLGTVEADGTLKHYIRRSGEEELREKKFPQVVSNDELLTALNDENVQIIDVREYAEYAFEHIKGAISIPISDLESKMEQLDKEKAIYVVCRTGNRSDMACQQLAAADFPNVKNVVPGMSEWNGPTEKSIEEETK
ncbi:MULTISPECIES: sulfurtransferase TusA family protein [Sporosarcina]|uniref:Sulfurtransferase TusA family protein n=1 Tax=Sporosarcina contaminans TaxID=633403 RepID=A0ABW3TXR4_9BACL